MTDPAAHPSGWTSCAALSRGLSEQPAGSAPVATGWIAVEHDAAWSPRAPSTDELGDVVARLEAPDVRVQLIRRPRRVRDEDRSAVAATSATSVTVLLGHAAVAPGDRWLRRVEVADLAALADLVARLPASVTTSPTPPSIGDEVEHDVWLVCTHGRRDACCAVNGRPVAAALEDDGIDVWETTHTGGHRFAATAVVLPDGLSLARLDDHHPAATAAALARGELPAALLRGRGAVPRPVQAAEALARASLDVTARDGLLPVNWSTDGDDTTVRLAGTRRRWVAVVRTAAVERPRAISDDAEPTRPAAHRLLALEEDVRGVG